MGPLDRRKSQPRPGKIELQPFELFQMQCRKRLESRCPLLGQLQPDDPTILLAPDPPNEPGGLGPVSQTDGTVMPEKEIVGHLTDGWALMVTMSPYGEEQLVVCRG